MKAGEFTDAVQFIRERGFEIYDSLPSEEFIEKKIDSFSVILYSAEEAQGKGFAEFCKLDPGRGIVRIVVAADPLRASLASKVCGVAFVENAIARIEQMIHLLIEDDFSIESEFTNVISREVGRPINLYYGDKRWSTTINKLRSLYD